MGDQAAGEKIHFRFLFGISFEKEKKLGLLSEEMLGGMMP